jgi:hypothetical protein
LSYGEGQNYRTRRRGGLKRGSTEAPSATHGGSLAATDSRLLSQPCDDGSIPTLEAVLTHYSLGGHRSRFRSERVTGFTLAATGGADLPASLNSLTDEEFLKNPALGRRASTPGAGRPHAAVGEEVGALVKYARLKNSKT